MELEVGWEASSGLIVFPGKISFPRELDKNQGFLLPVHKCRKLLIKDFCAFPPLESVSSTPNSFSLLSVRV